MAEYFKLPDKYKHISPPTYKISAIRPGAVASKTDAKQSDAKHPDAKHPNAKHPARPYQCAIVVPIYNRYLCLRIALFCLRRSQLENSLIVFLDDTSDDQRVLNLLDNFRHKQADTMVIRRQAAKDTEPKPIGMISVPQNLAYCMQYLFGKKLSSYIAILDSDTLVNRLWLPKLMSIYTKVKEGSHRNKPLIVSGFNTFNHPICGLEEDKDFYYKKSMGGINMLFDELTYRKIFIPLHGYWDDRVVEKINKVSPRSLLCSRPSVVQHTGIMGINAHKVHTDFAYDYLMPAWLGKMFHKFQLMLIAWAHARAAKRRALGE